MSDTYLYAIGVKEKRKKELGMIHGVTPDFKEMLDTLPSERETKGLPAFLVRIDEETGKQDVICRFNKAENRWEDKHGEPVTV